MSNTPSPPACKALLPVALALCALCLVGLAACGPTNNVRLLYKPAATGDQALRQTPGAATVAVVRFADKRGKSQLGVRRDGSAFDSATPVGEWAARSLADELERLGLRAGYAENLGQAHAFKPACIVSGSVEEAWLKQDSYTDMAASIRVTVNMTKADKHVFTESFNAGQQRTGLPSDTAAEDILLGAMQEIVQPAAQKLRARMGQ